MKASLAHPRVPGGVTRRGHNRRSNQRGFVILTPYILCSNCCCHQFNYVGLQPANNTSHAMISTHLPVKPSRRRPQHHLRPPPGLLHQPFHLFLEVQKHFVDTQEDRSTLSTSFSSSRVSLIQASTLRGSRHTTNSPWKGWTGAPREKKGNPSSPDSLVAIFCPLPPELSCSQLVCACVCRVPSTVTKDAVAADSSFSYEDVSKRAL